MMGLERGPLSLVSIFEELLGRKSNGSGLENRDYGRREFATLTTRHPLYLQKLALTSPTSCGRSVGIVRSQTIIIIIIIISIIIIIIIVVVVVTNIIIPLV
jgi:hypothetical protein